MGFSARHCKAKKENLQIDGQSYANRLTNNIGEGYNMYNLSQANPRKVQVSKMP